MELLDDWGNRVCLAILNPVQSPGNVVGKPGEYCI